MAKYASDTTVPADRSRAEIEATIERYGGKNYTYANRDNVATIIFEMEDRLVQFVLTLPERSSFTQTATGRRRVQNSTEQAYQQAVRQQWRALLLVIKGKLEGVESNIETFEMAFLANIVLPNSLTVGKWLLPQVAEAYKTNTMPTAGLVLSLSAGQL